MTGSKSAIFISAKGFKKIGIEKAKKILEFLAKSTCIKTLLVVYLQKQAR